MIFEKGDLGLSADHPAWPPSLGLLCPEWMLEPRESWTGPQWREYAEQLEQGGHSLVAQIAAARSALHAADSKLKRSEKVQAFATSLLDAFPERGKSGRPRGSGAMAQAARALVVQAELRLAKGKRVTDQEALTELFRRDGKPAFRVAEHRAIINAMVKLRRSNHNNMTT